MSAAQDLHSIPGMETSTNGIESRVKALEVYVRQMESMLSERSRQVDLRIAENRQECHHGHEELMKGIQMTHKMLYQGTEKHDGVLLQVDRLRQQQEAQSKLKQWFIGFITSGGLLALGLLLGRLLGAKP